MPATVRRGVDNYSPFWKRQGVFLVVVCTYTKRWRIHSYQPLNVSLLRPYAGRWAQAGIITRQGSSTVLASMQAVAMADHALLGAYYEVCRRIRDTQVK
jgi:hypothetical protein